MEDKARGLTNGKGGYRLEDISKGLKIIMKKQYKLKEDGMPLALMAAIDIGGKKTIKEWAKYFNTTYFHIATCLTTLRKRGHHYHPYSGGIRVGNAMRTGIVVDINSNAEWLRSGISGYEDSYSLPFLAGTLRMVEDGVEKHPELQLELQAFVDNLQTVLIQSRKRPKNPEELSLTSGKK